MAEQNIALWGWEAATNTWHKIAVTAAGLLRLDMAGISLGDLGDVNLVGIGANDIIYWNAVAGEWRPIAIWVAAHAASHQNGGADEINVAGLSGQLADDQHVKDAEVLAVAAALLHAARHQNGGADEINVAGLSGQLADDQHVKDAEVLAVAAALLHAARHQNGGADEINVAGLSGQLADDQHVKDAEVLLVAAALVHAARHQNGGLDEINVTGLSGQLADDQHVKDAEVDLRVAIHALLTTGIHGVGAGAIVGTTLAQILSNKTLTAPTLNGNITLGATPAFVVGAGEVLITTTGASKGVRVNVTNNGNAGAEFAGHHASASPAVGDKVTIFGGIGRNDAAAALWYGQLRFMIENPVAATQAGKIVMTCRVPLGDNEVVHISSTGVLDVDASSGLAAATVGEFDDLDDALILKQGISGQQLEALEKIGVMKRKDTGSGWMLNIQAMCYLLAGGIYQTRAKVDELNERMSKLELALPQGEAK